MTRVLIADSNAQFRSALRRLVERDGDIEVAGEATSLPEALAACERLSPDIALVDLGLPGLEQVGDLAQLSVQSPGVGLILLSLLEPPAGTEAGLDEHEHLLKSGPADEIVVAIRRRSRAAAPVSS